MRDAKRGVHRVQPAEEPADCDQPCRHPRDDLDRPEEVGELAVVVALGHGHKFQVRARLGEGRDVAEVGPLAGGLVVRDRA
jgi:hypothetical protein